MFSQIHTKLYYYPLESFITILILMLIILGAYRYIKNLHVQEKITRQKGMLAWLLIIYIILVLFYTVFGRRSYDIYQYNFNLGWSYERAFIYHERSMIIEILLNMLLFFPIGCLMGIICKRFALIKSLILGLILSGTIEGLQLVLRRGTCEYDDIMSNTIGTVIGCIIMCILLFLLKIYKKIRGDKRKHRLDDLSY